MPASISTDKRVVDHRFVVDRQQLLADGPRDRIEPRPDPPAKRMPFEKTLVDVA